ncbi:hypothetical protein R1flu_021047 [Riccia fluitans]|uniref:Uncharacterized protein n=1 Tax=Riccia fluitans TaxID=41844 RepID=A0ABD1ZN84_9MARC
MAKIRSRPKMRMNTESTPKDVSFMAGSSQITGNEGRPTFDGDVFEGNRPGTTSGEAGQLVTILHRAVTVVK